MFWSSTNVVELSFDDHMVRWWGVGDTSYSFLGVKYMCMLPQLKRTCQFLFWGAKDVLTSPAPHLKYFLPSPQIYVMTLTLPFSLGSSINVLLSMDNTYQQFDPWANGRPTAWIQVLIQAYISDCRHLQFKADLGHM